MAAIRIDAGLLIPGRGEPVTGGSVVLEGAKIAYAGPTAGAPDVAEVVTVPTVMPGLWECHAHFTGITVPDLEHEMVEPIVARAARAAADVERALLGGVTSAREVGGLGIDVRRAIADGTIRGPSIYSAGTVLSTTGGHADVHAFPLDWVTSADNRIGSLCDGVPA